VKLEGGTLCVTFSEKMDYMRAIHYIKYIYCAEKYRTNNEIVAKLDCLLHNDISSKIIDNTIHFYYKGELFDHIDNRRIKDIKIGLILEQ